MRQIGSTSLPKPWRGGSGISFCLEIADGVLQIIHGVINPAKLAYLGLLTRLRETRLRS